MLGDRGNNTYIVDNAGDQVIEYSGAGTDVIQSSVGFALSDNVENLILTGTAAINGIGNAQGNTLAGNSVANVLNGGAGNDTLIGGAGNDTVIFTSLSDMGTTGFTNVINDFVRGQDKIDLGTLDAMTSTSFSNEAFSFIGNAVAFTGAAQLRLQDSVLYGNTDTDSEAEFAIKLVGVTTLAATDIIL
ncbi:M10 family metallopeptidase C-terminal domain-containing protein [Pseudomonas laurylsulfatiphila]|uniref:M10 family metallopeptidase C-terminal domain-containing protein n=1 Tax=Pseudomonas laurylsulfatiphila TaxID=2011015 RepID=UPI003D1FC7BA